MNSVQDASTIIYRLLSSSSVVFVSVFSLILVLFSCGKRLIGSIVAVCIFGLVYWVIYFTPTQAIPGHGMEAVWLILLYSVITIFAGTVFLITSFMIPDSISIAIIINLLAFVMSIIGTNYYYSKYHV